MRWPWEPTERRHDLSTLSESDLTEEQKRSLDLSERDYREQIERRLRLLELQVTVFAREGGR